MNSYQPNDLGSTLVALVFYLLMAAFVIYSLIAIYSLLRYGRSKSLGTIVVVIYLIIIGALYSAATINLNNL